MRSSVKRLSAGRHACFWPRRKKRKAAGSRPKPDRLPSYRPVASSAASFAADFFAAQTCADASRPEQYYSPEKPMFPSRKPQPACAFSLAAAIKKRKAQARGNIQMEWPAVTGMGAGFAYGLSTNVDSCDKYTEGFRLLNSRNPVLCVWKAQPVPQSKPERECHGSRRGRVPAEHKAKGRRGHRSARRLNENGGFEMRRRFGAQGAWCKRDGRQNDCTGAATPSLPVGNHSHAERSSNGASTSAILRAGAEIAPRMLPGSHHAVPLLARGWTVAYSLRLAPLTSVFWKQKTSFNRFNLQQSRSILDRSTHLEDLR